LAVHEQLVFAVSMVLRDRREALDISQSDLARKSGLHLSEPLFEKFESVSDGTGHGTVENAFSG
jgi:hypothetical protein